MPRSIVMVLGLTLLTSAPARAQMGLDGYITGLAPRPQYQKELHLTPEQVEAIQAADRAAEARKEGSTNVFRALTGDARIKAFELLRKQNTEAYEKDLAAILAPEQWKRFREISLQAMGAPAFQTTKARDGLKLSEDQQAAIIAIIREGRPAMMAAGRPPKPVDRKANDEARRRFQEVKRELDEKLLAVLDDAQKAKWKVMIGEPFQP